MISAHLTIDPHFVVGPINRRLFGSFVEHLGRCVYDGIYEPGASRRRRGRLPHATSIELVARARRHRRSATPAATSSRATAGRTASGRARTAPRRLDLAWHSTETNEVGLDEFAIWLKKVGSELDVRRQPRHARRAGGARRARVRQHPRRAPTLSDQRDRQRRRRAARHPDVVPGQRDGRALAARPRHRRSDYGQLAVEDRARDAADRSRPRARRVRQLERPDAARSATWERVVLEETYDEVDFISCHAYYEPVDGDYGELPGVRGRTWTASSTRSSRPPTTSRPCAAATRRSTSRSTSGTSGTSRATTRSTASPTSHDWPVAPRLLEDAYSVVDAVVFGNLLISLIRHADRVTAASLAQLVNVIAPIMTEPGGPAWRQTTFFPFALTSRLARGVTLELKLDCPTYETARHGDVPVVDAVATHDAETGDTAVFLVNRSLDEAVEIVVDVSLLGDVALGSAETPATTTTSTRRTRCTTRSGSALTPNDSRAVWRTAQLRITLPPVSWTAVTLVERRREHDAWSCASRAPGSSPAADPVAAARLRPRRLDEHGELHHRLRRDRVPAAPRAAPRARRRGLRALLRAVPRRCSSPTRMRRSSQASG